MLSFGFIFYQKRKKENSHHFRGFFDEKLLFDLLLEAKMYLFLLITEYRCLKPSSGVKSEKYIHPI